MQTVYPLGTFHMLHWERPHLVEAYANFWTYTPWVTAFKLGAALGSKSFPMHKDLTFFLKVYSNPMLYGEFFCPYPAWAFFKNLSTSPWVLWKSYSPLLGLITARPLDNFNLYAHYKALGHGLYWMRLVLDFALHNPYFSKAYGLGCYLPCKALWLYFKCWNMAPHKA
jgi:hypothetical protein